MPGWLDLAHAAEYSCLSVRTLRRYLGHSAHPLPARLVGGKWLLAQHDLDRWLQGFPRNGEAVDQVVTAILKDLQRS